MHARLPIALAIILAGATTLLAAGITQITLPPRNTTTTSTTLAGPPASCGNGVREGDERCDGTDLGGKTCADVTSGFAQGGTLACNADCTFDVTDCRRAFIQSLIPASAGPAKNRCQLEWGTVGTTPDPKSRTKRSCSDGDATCDQDGQFNNSCTIRIQLCMNVPDDRVAGCAPAKIIRVDVLQPKLNSGDVNQKIASAVINAAKNAAFDQGHISENGVSFAPPITGFACGSGTVVIPLRGTTGHARPGKVKIRARSTDNTGKTRSIGNLSLFCMP